jgi:glycosyltransferase involved in cell wall biosynthesis
MSAPRVLFAGKGRTGVCWYRCALPAMYMGADWTAVHGDPGELAFVSGVTKDPMAQERFFDYDLVVLQQVRGARWARFIRELRAAGVRVLYEIDDDLHALRKKQDHDFKDQFSRELLRDLEIAMTACEGVIVSTPRLERRFRGINPTLWVCENGLDLGRYAVTRPPRDWVAFGWAGGTGHRDAVLPWLRELDTLMSERADVRFVSVGQPFADSLRGRHGTERCRSVPFHMLEVYPAAMTHFDVALAPAGRTNFYRAKSDLRWLEASALGMPTIADPVVYPNIEHGVTGFHAETPAQAGALMRELAGDPALRARVGSAARDHVRTRRDMRVAVEQWRDVVSGLLGSAPRREGAAAPAA